MNEIIEMFKSVYEQYQNEPSDSMRRRTRAFSRTLTSTASNIIDRISNPHDPSERDVYTTVIHAWNNSFMSFLEKIK